MKQTPQLELLQIASPCHVAWEDMAGDERSRFCQHCHLHVYNISDLSRGDAEAFIAGREGRTCVRLFRREDGTVLTRDCPVGVRYLRQRLARAVAAIAGLFVTLVSTSLFGGALSRLAHGTIKAPAEAFADWVDPQPKAVVLMGDVCLPPNPPPPPYCGPPRLDPAETPLLPPTGEQLEQIRQRLTQ